MKLIHVAFIEMPKKGKSTLFLRKISDQQYDWFEEKSDGTEENMEISAENPEEAIALARRKLKDLAFTPLACGYRYTLPERDEHGMNALFWQMLASYATTNGVYFDDELGHNCFVQSSPTNSLKLMKQLKEQNKV